MPRGQPKKPTSVRLDEDLVNEVRAHTGDLTAAIESGLRLWLAQIKRGLMKEKRLGKKETKDER